MAFFDALGNKIKNAGQTIAQSTKNFTDVTKYKNTISDYEKQIIALYTVVGKDYYERHKNDPNTEDKKNIDAISSLFNQISELKQKIKELEGVTKCPNCGNDVPQNALFCNNCGCKISKEEQSNKKCPSCGSLVPQDALFCNNCGNKIPEEPKGKLCSNCGKPLPEGSLFCASCGTKVEKEEAPAAKTENDLQTLCPACHTVLTEEDVFCPGCGAPVSKKTEIEDSSSEISSEKQEEV